MAGTMAFGDIYQGRSSTQESVNTGGSSKVPTRSDFELPILPNLAGFWNIPLPALIALGIIGFWLVQKYE